MKSRILAGLIALLVCGATWAAQDTDILPVEVRNPKLLEAWLEANAADAESRLVSNATNSNQLILIGASGGEAAVYMKGDADEDAGDYFGIVATDGSGLAIQSDAAVKGTLATKLTISSAGGIAAADAITLTDADASGNLTVLGYEAYDASLILDADQGDDTADTWTISATTANSLSISNGATEVATLSSAGALAVDAGISCADAVTLTDGDASGNLTVLGYEGYDASLILDADQGDDVADTWTISATVANSLSISNGATEVATLSSSGALAVDAGVAAGDAITLTDANGAAAIGAIAASGAYDATLTLDADAGEDNADTWIIESEAADNDLSFVNHTTEAFKISSAGAGTFTAGVTAGDTITLTDASLSANIVATGYEGYDASLVLKADEGDEAADTFTITATAGDVLSISNGTTEIATISSSGALQVDASVEAGTDLLLGGGDATISNAASSEAKLWLKADAQGDSSDVWCIAAKDGDDLEFRATNGASVVLGLDDGGVVTMAGGATLDNSTDINTLTMTETTVAISGAATVSGAATLASRFETTPVANVNVTNAQAVTLTGVINLLTAYNQASAQTNTITLANPTTSGQWAIIYNAAAATNVLAVAKTGNFTGPALDLGAGESAIIFATSATTWGGIGQ